MAKKYSEIISGSFIIVFSLFIFLSSFSIKMLTVSRIGSAFVPQLIAILLAVTGVFILIGGIKSFRATKLETAHNPAQENIQNQNQKKPARRYAVILTLIILLLYILFLEKVGFIIMTALYLFAQIYILAGDLNRKIPVFAAIAIIASLAIYFLFVSAFQLMLPSGILDLQL